MSLFESSTYSASRSSRAATLPALFEQLHDKMRSTTGFSAVALAASNALESLRRERREKLGWQRRTPRVENCETALEKLREAGNLFVVFGGATPKKERRSWVRGNAESGQLKGVAIALTSLPVDEEEELLFLTPSEQVGQWQLDRIPAQIFSLPGVFETASQQQQQPGRSEEEEEEETASKEEALAASLSASKSGKKEKQEQE